MLPGLTPSILPTLSSFVPSVSALYDVSLNTSDYYDISTNSTEINHLTDMPFGFFQYHLNGEGGGARELLTDRSSGIE